MADVEIASITVCCMCGDIGFSDKLFRCNNCFNRFQHSYCSNYYNESSSKTVVEVCDWCQIEQRSSSSSNSNSTKKGITTKNGTGGGAAAIMITKRSYSGDSSSSSRTKRRDHDDCSAYKGKINNMTSSNGSPSPRMATRRYKLLKDVMC